MKHRLKLTPLHEGLSVAVCATAVVVIFSVQHGSSGWAHLLRTGWYALLVGALAGATQGFVEARQGLQSGVSFAARLGTLLVVFLFANRLSRQMGDAFWAGGLVITAYFLAAFATWAAGADLSQRSG